MRGLMDLLCRFDLDAHGRSCEWALTTLNKWVVVISGGGLEAVFPGFAVFFSRSLSGNVI